MMQQLRVNLSIEIPDDYVLIKKVELEELKEESLSGVYWSMKDVCKRINKSDVWIKDNILYPSRLKRILDSENGRFVYYPKSQGQTWSFQAIEIAKFLENYVADDLKG